MLSYCLKQVDHCAGYSLQRLRVLIGRDEAAAGTRMNQFAREAILLFIPYMPFY